MIAIISSYKIVPLDYAYVIERLGVYNTTWTAGMHVKVPFIDKFANKVSLNEQVVNLPSQPIITKDNVTMMIDTVVYYRVTDPKLYTYSVENPTAAIEKLTTAALRNFIGGLDHTLASCEVINSKIRAILDEATDAWGINVNRVEIRFKEPGRINYCG